MTDRDEESQDVRDRLVERALVHVPFDGWCVASLRQAARDEGFDDTLVEWAFPGGVAEAVEHWSSLADRRLEAVARTGGLDAMPMDARIAWLVRHRLEPWSDHRESVRRAIALLALPGKVGTAGRMTWRTADTIWFAAGDHSADLSYYSKRMALSAIFTATLMFWLADTSEDASNTWDFLWRRITGALKFAQARKGFMEHFDGCGLIPRRLLSSGITRRRFGIRC